MKRTKHLAVALAAFALVATSAASATSDPARIVPWHQIGNIGLGMSKERVEYGYGPADRYGQYAVPGGWLMVNYDTRGVSGIATNSRRYRTASGLGVGTRIPLGPCHKTATSSCERRWNGFVYYPSFAHSWRLDVRRGKRMVTVQLPVARGVVTQVSIAYNDCLTPGACVD